MRECKTSRRRFLQLGAAGTAGLIAGDKSIRRTLAAEQVKEVRFMILDPGHFHAALVLKSMYPQVSPAVHVYAPEGPELQDFLNRIQDYNQRPQDPTRWDLKMHTSPDFMPQMVAQKPGNVMVTAGNNQRKTERIKASIDAGLHVFADKPMCIDAAGFKTLAQTLENAQKKGLLLYDIMTERFEITSILQKELVNDPSVFGRLQPGSAGKPSVTKESVHHFSKLVSGKPLQRPGWFFDVSQQGEGIVDVTTHLVDLVMWASFPGQIIDYKKDIKLLKAERWPTLITREQYRKVTGLAEFPNYLQPMLNKEGVLTCFCNGQIGYQLRGVHTRVSVIWNFEAPPGGGDTHYSVMRGTQAEVVIEQGAEQKYRPELYIQALNPAKPGDLGGRLEKSVQRLEKSYPGLGVQPEGKRWKLNIPDRYRVSHEAHFSQVTENFLKYLAAGKLPDWEVPNMIAKYYTTTQALELARSSPPAKRP